MKIKPALLIFIAIIAFVFCCSKSDETYTIEIKDGVKHIHNIAPLWGDEPKVTLEYVQTIGNPYSDNDAYKFRASSVAVDKNGNIYVADMREKRVQKYSRDGKYLSTIDIRQHVSDHLHINYYLQFSLEDILYVQDSRMNNTIRLLAYGTLIDTFTCENRVGRLALFSNGNIIAYPVERDPNRYNDEILLAVCDDNGTVIREFGDPVIIKSETVFNNVKYDIDKNDNVFASFTHLNRIDKYESDGTHIFTADRPLRYEPIDSLLIIDGSFLEVTWVTKGTGIDHKGRLWVATAHVDLNRVPTYVYLNNSVYNFNIFDSDGVLLGSMPMPICQREFLMWIFGSRLFLSYGGNYSIIEYRIVDK